MIERLWILMTIVLMTLFLTFLTLYIDLKGREENQSNNKVPYRWNSADYYPIVNDVESRVENANVNVIRHDYAMKYIGKSPLLTIVTRVRSVNDCEPLIQQCESMVCKDFEHVILEGVDSTADVLYAYRKEFKGRYVWIVDRLIGSLFVVSHIQRLTKSHAALKVIVVKTHHNGRVLPLTWKRFPAKDDVELSNVVILSSLFNQSDISGCMIHEGIVNNALKACSGRELYWFSEVCVV